MKDVNLLIKIYNDLAEKISQNRRTIETAECEYQNAIDAANKKYFALKNRGKEALAAFNPILENIQTLYPHFVKLGKNEISFCGERCHVIDYSEQNCEIVLESAIRTLKNVIASLLVNKGDVEKCCFEICRSYSTIVGILSAMDKFEKSELDKAKEKQASDIAEAEAVIEKLSIEKVTVERMIVEAMRDAESKMARLPLDGLQDEYVKNINIPLGVSYIESDGQFGEVVTKQGEVSSTAEWNASEGGILYFHADGKAYNSNCFCEYVYRVIMRGLCSYPVTRLLLCNKTADERIVSFGGLVSDYVPKVFFNKGALIKSTETEIAASLEDLTRTVMQRLVLLGKTGNKDILEYNAKNPDNAHPLIFILLHGYPQGFSHAFESLTGLFKNGRKAGVYFIVTVNDSVKIDDDYLSRKLPEIDTENKYELAERNGELRVCKGGVAYSVDFYDKTDFRGMLDLLKVSMAESSAIDFYSILPNENFDTSPRRNNFSKVLSIPIGKNGAKTLTVDLDSESGPHAVICGTTGSGKSSLINTMILSAASLYSPDELEINLISMVKSEFDVYKEQGLPHLKTLITKDDTEGAIDVLNYLQDEMQRRMNLVGSDIVAYNRTVPKEKHVPRSLIVIDEYQKLIEDERAREKMLMIAQLGRSCGMCLVLASQIVPSSFRTATTLFRHLFEFRADAVGDLIPEIISRKNELEDMPGLCFYKASAAIILARIAFPGKTADNVFQNKILEVGKRFPCHKMLLRSETVKQVINDECQIPYISRNTQREYDEDGICKIRLGTKYLSGVPLEYPFSYKNSLLCLCGEYTLTKNIEATIIKDVLRLSRDATIDYPTLFYIDLNRNPNWMRKKNVVKSQKDNWLLYSNGRFAYFGAAQVQDALDEVESLMHEREENSSNENYKIYPVIVMLTCVESLPSDSDESDILLSLMERGKNCNVFFVYQFNEFSYRCNDICRKVNIIEDAILVPDKYYEGEQYASSDLIAFLQQTEAAETTAREMLKTLVTSPLNPKLNILCNNSEVSCFIPYEYTEEYLASILKKE